MIDLKKVSEEVKSNEPETVQYQITQSDEDENEILIWEEVSPISMLAHHSFLVSLSLFFSQTHLIRAYS
jgi:hypothetical protein